MDLQNLTVKYLSSLNREGIKKIMQEFDAYNINYINNAFNAGIINEDSKEVLQNLYGDSLAMYRAIYRSIYEVFGSPLCTSSFDLETGKVDRDEFGDPIDYTLKMLSPLASSRVKFQDKNNNSIYVIFPKMKSVERSIEKITTEIDRERQDAIISAYDRYFQDDDIEELRDNLQDIPQSASQLQDVCRLTISCKYLSDIERIKRKLTEQGGNGKSPFFRVDRRKTRDKFTSPLSENKKRYFDIKMYMNIKSAQGTPFVVEVQLKPETIFKGHIFDHNLYEKKRIVESQILSSSSENEKKLKKQLLHYYEDKIQKLRDNNLHEYNMMVLDKVYRIEDTDYLPLEVEPDNPQDKTYNKCINFIRENYLVTSYDKFNSDIFAPYKNVNKMSFLKIIGKLPENFDVSVPDAEQIIAQKYGELGHLERRRFKNIVRIAERYSHVIQEVIDKRRTADSKELRLQKNSANRRTY